ncbi:TonB-dependent receptor [Sphingomonas sp. MG17]|uniref:TonB-dependent receptor n=1 Tax=Sphingomonas tagetis TaxID=2949092 RepID=A0A9X2KNR6_9SPHN|nr:TonB-dependent receptor [Sphingomonas tagetis]MCP3733092.1 TonB-dependent receptor [Sphingomonas tagetis]
MNISRLLTATALASASFVIPQTAFAQDTGDAAATEETDETIVVTGSRIRNANAESAAPITTVTAEEIFDSGRVSVGDVLNDLPQLRTTLGSQNSTGGLGTRGLNFLDLRGLGRSRTLTLINGRRQVSADIINGVFSNQGSSIDINTIPTDLIQSIDILTGGASSIYGSDAIAGVVNFQLKDDFEGIKLTGRAGISKYGDAGNQYLSATVGTNFADGRGNIALNAEFAHQEDYYASGRWNLRQNDAYVIVDTDTTPSADNVFDRVYYRDLRSTTISLGGQLGFRYANTPTAPCGVDAVGSSFTCAFLFNPDGTLTPQTGLRVGLGPNGNFVGGNGSSSREGQLTVLSPDLKRYVVNLIGHFEVSPAFVPFVEAKYVRTEAFGSQSGPFFSQGQTLGDNTTGIAGFAGTYDRSYANGTYVGGVLQPTAVNREGIRLDNPYLSASARATITAQLLAALNSGTTGVNPNTGTAFSGANAAADRAAAIAQVNAGTFRFSLRRNWLDLGTRDEIIKRDTYRFVGGVKGDFFDDFNYELSVNYGEHREHNTITGNINRQRLLLAIDTTRNAAGQIVCRSQIDAAYAGVDRGGNPAQLAADIAACVPLNPFGEGSVSQASKNYLLMNTVADGKATQFVVSGFVGGTLSKLFDLPGGPIGFAIGGEYRRETLAYDLDDLTSAGYAFYNALPEFNAPSFEVTEAFGELSLPLLKDFPLVQELTIHGSGRISKYKGNDDLTYAYGGDVVWKPVQDITIRGAYSRSVRAPYIGSLYTPQAQNFLGNALDPCSARNLATGSSTRAANCTAAGAPAGYDFVYTSSLEYRNGGNPDLKPEKADSYTAGVVLQPRWVPGLTISADYYDIQVNDVISTVAAQTILNQCYDSPTLSNPFCALFQRAGSGGGPRGEIPFRILEGSLLASPANYAKFKVRGVDVNVGYNRKFSWGEIALKGIYTHVIQNDAFQDPTRPNFKNVFTGELGDPQDQFNITADAKFGKVRVGYTMRWIGKQYLNTWEDYNAVNGQPAQNTDYADIKFYPVVTYHDVRLGYEVNEQFDFNLGINNVGDTVPPYGLTGVGAGSGIYDNRGRFFYVGATAKF